MICGLIYEVLYQVALALRWITTHEIYSFIIAGVAGLTIAVLVAFNRYFKPLRSTLFGLGFAFVFHLITGVLDVPLQIIFICDPFMKEVGHFTVNEGMTIGFVTVGYLFFSLLTYLASLGLISLFRKEKPEP